MGRLEEIPLEMKEAVSNDDIKEVFRLTRELYDMVADKDKELSGYKAGIKVQKDAIENQNVEHKAKNQIIERLKKELIHDRIQLLEEQGETPKDAKMEARAQIEKILKGGK